MLQKYEDCITYFVCAKYALSLLHGQMYSHHGHIDIDIDYILYARYRYALYHHQDHQIKYERCSYLILTHRQSHSTHGEQAEALHPTPNADSPHRATERATGDAEQTGKADTHGGGTGGHRYTQGDRRSRSGCGADRRRGRWADRTGQDRQSHPQTVRATQSRQDAAEGTATTADAEQAQRGTESRRRGFSCAV